MGIGFAHGFGMFLLMRLAIGIIGAAFVVTQYHTSVMFAPNMVGTANATAAGWGNMGGGITQFLMPAVFLWFVAHGLSHAGAWRASMAVAGIICALMGIAYFFLTQDTPTGNFKDLRARGELPAKKQNLTGFLEAARDSRVWMLFVIYASCFGIELTIDNIASLYFTDYFHMGLAAAGWTAAAFGLMNLFGRATGGIIGDRFGIKYGLTGPRSMALCRDPHRRPDAHAVFAHDAFGAHAVGSCGVQPVRANGLRRDVFGGALH